MNVTVQQMRKSVLGWLTEEGATVEQATELLSALHAGAIDGLNYKGKRESDDNAPWGDIDHYENVHGRQNADAYNDNEVTLNDDSCGCLVDSFERIKQGRPARQMGASTSEAYAFATMIGLGDTPSNHRWARAAAKGVEDYIVWLEAA